LDDDVNGVSKGLVSAAGGGLGTDKRVEADVLALLAADLDVVDTTSTKLFGVAEAGDSPDAPSSSLDRVGGFGGESRTGKAPIPMVSPPCTLMWTIFLSVSLNDDWTSG